MPRKVLVLGGTDFVGPAIVGAALARGDQVTIFHRGQTGAEPDGVRVVHAYPHTGSVVRIDSMSNFGGYDGARRVP